MNDKNNKYLMIAEGACITCKQISHNIVIILAFGVWFLGMIGLITVAGANEEPELIDSIITGLSSYSSRDAVGLIGAVLAFGFLGLIIDYMKRLLMPSPIFEKDTFWSIIFEVICVVISVALIIGAFAFLFLNEKRIDIRAIYSTIILLLPMLISGIIQIIIEIYKRKTINESN